jgi:hypothetical protein
LGETEVAGMERVTGYPLKMKEYIDIVVHWDVK